MSRSRPDVEHDQHQRDRRDAGDDRGDDPTPPANGGQQDRRGRTRLRSNRAGGGLDHRLRREYRHGLAAGFPARPAAGFTAGPATRFTAGFAA